MIINIDAKSLEWCTYLYLSQDKIGIQEWNDVLLDPTKHDIHKSNQIDFNLPSRLIAKIFLFRWIYRGPAYAYAYDPDFSSINNSVDYWQSVIDRYYNKYKDIYKTHLSFIKEATTTGQLISPFGRVHKFYPKKKFDGSYLYSESDITNWINQGVGADVMAVVRAVAKQHMRTRKITGKLISTVHDSVVIDTPDNEIYLIASLFDKIFRDLPILIEKLLGVSWNVPMRCEIKIGKNMLEMTEISLDNMKKICNT